jgi:hypothetical protein
LERSSVIVVTNNVPRLIIDAYELTEEERKEFDYLDWEAIESGEANPTFFRYCGTLYDLGEFETTGTVGYPREFRVNWDGIQPDSFFSGILVRFVDDDHVIIGRYCA